MDSGISQADIRPIRYENGDVMIEQGKIYLSASIRLQEGCFQGIFSWVPGTAQFELTGALFFDAGDGLWAGDVASSILKNRANRISISLPTKKSGGEPDAVKIRKAMKRDSITSKVFERGGLGEKTF